MAATDFLGLFRDCVAQGGSASLDGSSVVFALPSGQLRFDKEAPTNFRDSKGQTASLQQLYYAYQHRHERWDSYFTDMLSIGGFLLKEEFHALTGFWNTGDASLVRPFRDGAEPAAPEPQPTSTATSLPQPPSSSSSSSSSRPSDRESRSSSSSSSSRTDAAKRSHRSDAHHHASDSDRLKKARSTSSSFSWPRPSGEHYEVSAELQRLRDQELPYATRLSMLDVPKSFEQIMEMVQKTSEMEQMQRQQKAREAARGAAAGAAARTPARQKTTGPPIIIVPSATASIFTMANIKKFLEDGEYVEASKTVVPSVSKEGITIARPVTKFAIEGNPTKYLVIDNVLTISPDDWERVTAVITFGPDWQFKSYRWSNPTDLFANTCGFYFHFKGVEQHPNAKKWNVRSLEIPQEKVHSHQSQTSWLQFWNHLERWVNRKRGEGVTYST